MCGIFAFLGAAPDQALVLRAVRSIRHRGQDGFGFWHGVKQGDMPRISHFRQSGKTDLEALAPLLEQGFSSGRHAFVAHWRYGTRGAYNVAESQPLLLEQGRMALVHNGQFAFQAGLRSEEGTDTQIFSRLLTGRPSGTSLIRRMQTILPDVSGAYTIVIAHQDSLLVARDPFGFRPFFHGLYPGGIAFASETTALQIIGCEQITEIPAGEIIERYQNGWIDRQEIRAEYPALCAFEPIYFHGPEGQLNGISVKDYRHRLGYRLAQESPVVDSIIVSVPRSADDFADGFAAASGLKRVRALEVRPEAARTFIQNSQSREDMILQKYRLDPDKVRGQNITLVDDSLVRGATMRYLTVMLREAGARSVHVRIGSPPFRFPCYYGINVPDPSELAAHEKRMEEIARELGLDSLRFLSEQGLKAVLGDGICTGCFSGRYPEENRAAEAEMFAVAAH